MKKRTGTILTLAIATVGFIALGFSKKEVETKVDNANISEANFSPTTVNTNFFPAEIIKMKNTKKSDLDLFYMVKGKYSLSVSEGKLKKARDISEFIPDLPTSWISSYNFIEITTKSNNKIRTAYSENGVLLTDEQKNLLSNAEIDTPVSIAVNYKSRNSISEKYDDREMQVSFTVVPETKAEFVGGYDNMIAYLKEHSLKKIEAAKIKEFKPVSITFQVDENGETESINLTNSCGNHQINSLLIKVIENMPKWKPAVNSNGEKVKQQFELIVGPDMC